jgi:cation transporter-like permease
MLSPVLLLPPLLLLLHTAVPAVICAEGALPSSYAAAAAGLLHAGAATSCYVTDQLSQPLAY